MYILKTQDQATKFYMCSKCNWPLCGKACEDSVYHSKECEIMKNAKHKFNMADTGVGCRQKESRYCVIAPLRMLLLRNYKKNE